MSEAGQATYIECLEFAVGCAESLLRPDRPVIPNLDPTFYHSLTYEGDVELVEKCRAARIFLNKLKEYQNGTESE